MASILNWFGQNWSYICSAGFIVIMLASIIVKFTKTSKDDEVATKIVEFLDNISIAKTDIDKKLINLAKDILSCKKKEQ